MAENLHEELTDESCNGSDQSARGVAQLSILETNPHIGEDAPVSRSGTAAWTEAAILSHVKRLAEEWRRETAYRCSQVDVIKEIQKVDGKLHRVSFGFRGMRSVCARRGRRVRFIS